MDAKKKILLGILFASAISISPAIPALANELPNEIASESNIITSDNSKSSDFIESEARFFGKSKTVKKNYSSIKDIPDSIDYEEYIDGNWYSGNLKWTGDAVLLSNSKLYEATFKGTLYK